MTPSRVLGVFAATAAAATVGMSGVAQAHAGDKTFQQTFPIASQVCAKVSAGSEGHRLKRFATSVLADCTTLQTTFTTTHATVLTARAALEPQIAADRATIAAACPTPPSAHRPVCVQAHQMLDPTLKSLRDQKALATHTYYKTVEAARVTFWSAIRSLPFLHHVKTDKPIPIQSS